MKPVPKTAKLEVIGNAIVVTLSGEINMYLDLDGAHQATLGGADVRLVEGCEPPLKSLKFVSTFIVLRGGSEAVASAVRRAKAYLKGKGYSVRVEEL